MDKDNKDWRESQRSRVGFLTQLTFANILEPIRRAARDVGWCVAVHGSLRRDIDLVAIPWIDDASSETVLVETVLETVKAAEAWACLSMEVADKPHGRRGYVITLAGGPYIDLSVMPRVARSGEVHTDPAAA